MRSINMGLIDMLKNFKELKKSVKESAELSNKYLQMTDEEVLAFADDDICDAIYERIGNKAEKAGNFNSLSKYQLAFFIVYEFDMEIQNGGLCQYLCNSTGEKSNYVEYSLKTLSFDKTAELFSQFVKDNNIDLNCFDEDVDYDELLEKYDFDKFDDAYYELYEEEQIYNRMVEFAREKYDLLK